MASLDRRNSMTLDEVGRYWRELRTTSSPSQNKVCNSIATIDLAFDGEHSTFSKHLSRDKWERIRADLFNVLISSFPGYWNVFETDGADPLDLRTSDWPVEGYIEFCPTRSNRQSDILRSDLSALHPSIVLALRWCWAEGINHTSEKNFEAYQQSTNTVEDDSQSGEEAGDFLDRLYEICVDEAVKSKRIAHRAWWRLSAEVRSCEDKAVRNQLRKQILELESVWGVPSP